MKGILCTLTIFLFCFSLQAQFTFTALPLKNPTTYHLPEPYYSNPLPVRKLMQRNYGIIVGLQRGNITAIELGGEAHWRKMSLKNPQIWAVSGNMEYNFGHNVLGYKAGVWRKQGRINFTYGANLAYYTDFHNRSRYGIGPAVGFRLLGFHLINGYNILAGDKEFNNVNKLYVSLRYYFSKENKFEWDRKTRKRKEQKKKQRAKEKAQREKQKDNGTENNALQKLKNLFKKKQEE